MDLCWYCTCAQCRAMDRGKGRRKSKKIAHKVGRMNGKVALQKALQEKDSWDFCDPWVFYIAKMAA